MGTAMEKDFFVSYTASDSQWAVWIAWQLEEAGYSAVLQAWDFVPGSSFVLEMDRAAKIAAKTIAVLSHAYLERSFTRPEWAAAFARDPTGNSRSLLPVRVLPCEIDGLLAQVVYIDLVGLEEKEARRRLLAGVGGKRAKPTTSPIFPGAAPPSRHNPFPGKQISSPDFEGPLVSRSLLCARLASKGLLDLGTQENPYGDLFDPTDQASALPQRFFMTVWLPGCDYVKNRTVEVLTPAAICTLDPEGVVRRAEQASKRFSEITLKKPSGMLNEEREELVGAMAFALKDSFASALSVPTKTFGTGKRRAKAGYISFVEVFVLPLLEMHLRMGFADYRLRLSNVGGDIDDEVIKLVKGGARKIIPAKNDDGMVEFVADNNFWAMFAGMARFLAWGVHAYYSSGNSGNREWLTMLREKLEHYGNEGALSL